MIKYQQTIKNEVELQGVGLHTGKEVKLKFIPAPANHGYKFQRIDIDGEPIIKADCDLVTDIARGTTLEFEGVKIATVEHALSALAGLEIDNVLIQLDQPELPIMDGSAKPFIDALLNAGIKPQSEIREYFDLDENIELYDEEKQVRMLALPSEEFQVTVMVDYNSPVLGSQNASFNHIAEFKDEFADARTFCFLHELEHLYENNLIKGGDLNNAIVIVDRVVEDNELARLAKMFNKEKVEVKKEGILNNVELRYQNEPARHKLLDVVGDLSLIGTPIKARIIGSRPGHKTNIEFAKLIKKHIIKKKKAIKAPKYDPNKAPIFTAKDILQMLPHASPMLLVDKIIELNETQVIAVKSVTYNEPFFPGHFPDNPIMPGVLIVEAMAQSGGILAMQSVDDPKEYVTYFMRIEKARFKNPVYPGDTIIFDLKLLRPIRRGICEMKGVAYVGNKIVSEAVLVAQIAKKPE